ncbi:MAG: DegV family protein [Chloroflexi bacterium]|nr:DegV family protein [Chloroflexota bacterium]
MTIKVVTDSTADLPRELAQELDITVVPLNVHFGTQVFLDGVEIASEEFFRRLTSESVLPTTSQPSVGAMVQVYRDLAAEHSEIVSVHISSKLSGTVNSALQAARELEGSKKKVEVVDSAQASAALGLVVVAAARAAQQGASMAEVVATAQRVSERIRVLFMVDTLEYLAKGGRIGKAQAFLGSLLRIKPILTVQAGEIHPLERVRTRARAIERMWELAQEGAPYEGVAVAHATTPREAADLAQRIQKLNKRGSVIECRFGPVLGTHVGPGALGLAVQSAG